MTNDEILEMERKLEKLRAFVGYYVNCPCCGEDDKCLDECTFAEDCPDGIGLMEQAREAMR